MLELPHTLAGIAIASLFPDPLVSLPLALGSHFVLDAVPHWDPDVNRLTPATYFLLVSDSLSALVLGLYASWHFHSVTMLVCAFLAVLPDLISIPHYFFKNKYFASGLIKWQSKFHSNTSPLPGFLTQFASILVSLLLIFK